MTTRRNFIKKTSIAATALSVFSSQLIFGKEENKPLRIGFIGINTQSQKLMQLALLRADVEIKAICSTQNSLLEDMLNKFEKEGKPQPEIFSNSKFSYRNILAIKEIDVVIISSQVDSNFQICIDAMNAGKHVGCDEINGATLEDLWKLIDTNEQTGMNLMLMGNGGYRRNTMATINMVQQGLFGKIIQLQGNYFMNSLTENYCSNISALLRLAEINNGDRIVSLSSYKSKISDESVTTLLKTENGKSILLQQYNSYEGADSCGIKLQGNKGFWSEKDRAIYLEGISIEPDCLEDASSYLKKYDHPLWKKFEEENMNKLFDSEDDFELHQFLEIVKSKTLNSIDVYNVVVVSAIKLLIKQRLERGGRSVDFPDFTRGKWELQKNNIEQSVV